MTRIAHLTSVHARMDTRIFHKMCRSLARHGHEVHLVVADGKGDALLDGVAIHDVGASRGRLDRMRRAPKRVLRKALELDADLHHLHDPELLPIGTKLKRLGRRVVFDSHEDVPQQLLGKPYLNAPARRALSVAFGAYESRVCRRLDGVVAATPFIRDKFLRVHPNTIDISNFPLLDELVSDVAWGDKTPEVCYLGGLARSRGIREICEAMDLVKSGARLNVAGTFFDAAFAREVRAIPGWRRVNDLGFLDRAGVRDVLARSMAGVVTLHPLPAFVDSQPIKMFEYMSAGIPVIASDFPRWRDVIEGSRCGVLVDPLDPAAIAAAIDHLVDHPGEAREMGANGRRAVVERYNWSIEERRLLAFYDRILEGTAAR